MKKIDKTDVLEIRKRIYDGYQERKTNTYYNHIKYMPGNYYNRLINKNVTG